MLHFCLYDCDFFFFFYNICYTALHSIMLSWGFVQFIFFLSLLISTEGWVMVFEYNSMYVKWILWMKIYMACCLGWIGVNIIFFFLRMKSVVDTLWSYYESYFNQRVSIEWCNLLPSDFGFSSYELWFIRLNYLGHMDFHV